MDRYPHPDRNDHKTLGNDYDVFADLEAAVPLRVYMVRLSRVMIDLGQQLVMGMQPYRFEDHSRIAELIKTSKEASMLGRELLAEVPRQKTAAQSQRVMRRIQKENGASLASNPIQSNPIQSNPIQSNPIQSNPIQSNPSSGL